MRLYKTRRGVAVEEEGVWYDLPGAGWDAMANRSDLLSFLRTQLRMARKLESGVNDDALLAPIGSQEVWAAGVTYVRSREARMEESKDAGGGSFYDRVYGAERPELFFKATAHRVAGPGAGVRIRKDSKWNVPEPELALLVSSGGKIVGYTIGNDMSSRDIEGENPLYLPQAKVYDGSCGLGPGVLVAEGALGKETEIRMEVRRKGEQVFGGGTTLARMKRTPEELVGWLFRESSFPNGCYLLTGTGVVPPDDFTLHGGDEVRITIEPIGTLVNGVA